MITNRKMEALSEAEAWTLARRAQIGRLAVIVDDHPEIFPVNYVVDRGSVLLRTSAGTKLSASIGHAVAFEMDGFDAECGDAWSVVIKGTARELTGLYEVLDAMELPLHTWHPMPKPCIVRIEPTEITGRRFPRAGTSAARVVSHLGSTG
jgi:nitroimidazol reductase NimA-like FMN-containing flavoprotein (pyridoxamine 5'-phosphate oxidase superfamily)